MGGLVKASWSAFLQFLQSTAGIGRRLLQIPTLAHSQRIGAVNKAGDGYELIDAQPVLAHQGDSLGVIADPANAGEYIWGLIHAPENPIPHYTHLPDATATSPDLVHLTHVSYSGVREDAQFNPQEVGTPKGFNDGLFGAAYGSLSNDTFPLRRIVTSLTSLEA